MCAYQQRHSYLRERGFAFDPFDDPVAESEMFANSQATGFLSYFVPCDVLRDSSGRSVFTPDPATNTLVYGPRGSGRTAIRFAWEVSHRVARSDSLRVTHVLNDLSQGTTLSAQRTQLLEALATDLFLQIIEHFNPRLQSITDDMIIALRTTIAHGSLLLQDSVRRMLDAVSTEALKDISVCWQWLGRPTVGAVAVSEALVQLIRACVPASDAAAPPARDALADAIAAAHAWGYRQIVVAVDIGSQIDHSSAHTLRWLQSLPGLIAAYHELHVSFQLFLPLSARKLLQPAFSALEHVVPLDELSIVWNEDQLRAVLAQRFHAAGMRSDGLYALADDSIGPDLDHLALMAAAGSPRRMLQVISALFDLHATSAHRSRLIQRQDWLQLCAAWRDHDYPLPLPNTRGDS